MLRSCWCLCRRFSLCSCFVAVCDGVTVSCRCLCSCFCLCFCSRFVLLFGVCVLCFVCVGVCSAVFV